jgi:NAD(P)-dependent dehydrogenase (short-subunit alcohol dehydrogenase family)
MRVWIVGASSGIGSALADALREQGALVAVSARGADTLRGDLVLPLDVRDGAALKHAAQQVAAAFGGLDLLVYCAGTYRPQRATAFDLEQALNHDEINYRGALRTLDAVLPLLLRQRSGHLVLVSSVAGWRGLPQALAYGPTKAALISLAETLYVDLRPQGIGVSVVNPGFVQTPLTAQNRFRMPALMQPAQAAQCILRGLRRRDFDIHFPRRFTLWLRLLRVLPYRLYFAVVGRIPEV